MNPRNVFKPFSPNKRTKGQSMVEFALAFPIILLITLGIIELGRFFFTYISVYIASREAARYGSAAGLSESGVPRYWDCNMIEQRAIELGFFAGLDADDIDLGYDTGPDSTVVWGCPQMISGGSRIVVSIETDYSTIVPMVNLPPLKLRSHMARTIIVNVDVSGIPPSPTPRPWTKTPTKTPSNTPTPTFTYTPTPTETPGPSPTPSNPPTPTATFTPTNTYTPTPTNTPSPTLCPPSVCTPTPTNTPTPTYTPTPTPTSTYTPTPTFTPTPNCSNLTAGSVTISKDRYSFDISNTSIDDDDDFSIVSVSVGWLPSDNFLYMIQFGNSTIWGNPSWKNSTQGSPPPFNSSTFNSGSNFVLDDGAKKKFELNFQGEGYTNVGVSVNFSNGCTIKR